MSTRASHLRASIVKPLHLNGLDDKALVTRQPPQVTVAPFLTLSTNLASVQATHRIYRKPFPHGLVFQASNVMHLDS